MDCRTCKPETEHENLCSSCAAELLPLVEYMVDSSGDRTWRDNGVLMFDRSDVKEVDAFLAGSKLHFRSTPSLFCAGRWQVEKVGSAYPRMLTPDEQSNEISHGQDVENYMIHKYPNLF